MNRLTKRLIKLPLLGRTALTFYRATSALGYLGAPLLNVARWTLSSNEVTNYTYDLEDLNKQYLLSLIAVIMNIPFERVVSYAREIEGDTDLRNHIARVTKTDKLAFLADDEVHLGRRIGWYVFARALKPKTIVETGVDKGLGACVLTAALRRNGQEGVDGHYFGTDIDESAGYLLSGEYANYGRILYGDSIGTLKNFDRSVDLFINDSDHSPEYEEHEYRVISDKLSTHAIVLGDNSHCTDKLLQFSLATNRAFVFFQEKPVDHWYPGAGIGISFKRSGSPLALQLQTLGDTPSP